MRPRVPTRVHTRVPGEWERGGTAKPARLDPARPIQPAWFKLQELHLLFFFFNLIKIPLEGLGASWGTGSRCWRW